MSFLELNKKVLISKYPGLFEELNLNCADDLRPEDIKTETAPTGDPTLSIKGLFVHSPRDPSREAQRLVESLGSPFPDSRASDSPIVILGFGLGYTAQAASSLGRPIIIAEKHRSLILKALQLRDFSEFLSANRLIFLIGGSADEIINALAIASKFTDNAAEKRQAPSVIRNKTLTSLDEQWYKSIEERIRTWTMRDDVNAATHKRFGKRWVRNLTRNMSAIRDLPGVSHLAGIASKDTDNLPVFLAAAGPSLDKIKPLLRDIYERCIIVAVDTSLRFFVHNGIQPDFVLVVDPQFWNCRHLDRCTDNETCNRTALVAESAVYPPALNLPFKNKFLCSSLFPLGEFVEKQVDHKGRLGAGGSVATTAWDFARLLGANEIWTAGLDLAFPGLKTHFRGARFEERSNSESNRFNPAEKWIMRVLRDGFPFKAPSACGEQVLTDRRLSLYAAWFENNFRLFPQVQNYSLFAEGLAIAGLQAADTQKFLKLPCRRGEIDSRIKPAFLKIEKEFNADEEKQKRFECYEKAVSVLTDGMKNIRTAAEEGAEITRRALRYPLNQSQQNKVLKELDEITRRLSQSEVKEIAGFLFPPVINEDENQSEEKDQFRSFLKTSQKLFAGILEASQ
ncbi:MAG: DUF115 domain-containing protein [Treponema sp.]|nr:DUF115 domain-containing protein [Treponema sp.]